MPTNFVQWVWWVFYTGGSLIAWLILLAGLFLMVTSNWWGKGFNEYMELEDD